MKSLNDIYEQGRHLLEDADANIFTDKILAFLEKEGFEINRNDSYNEELKGSNCYKKYAGDSGSWPIYVYVGINGIAVDLDYDCGGNSSNIFFRFWDKRSEGDNPFEYTYGQMVDHVNDLRNRS